jgi:hypothetical protein
LVGLVNLAPRSAAMATPGTSPHASADQGWPPARSPTHDLRRSVLDAIREGDWYFEPERLDGSRYDPTSAIPGTKEKLSVLAERARAGLPLWHDQDRPDYEEPEAGLKQ